jgi:aspartate aminotransferase-like enzyme
MSSARPPYRLRLPGPTTVPERVRTALASPVLNHRGPEFAEIFAETTSLLRKVAGTSNEILLFACSGTGMMEASLANVLAPGDKALIVVNGQFAERFVTIARALGSQADTIDVPWGHSVDTEVLTARLAGGDYRAVVAVHNESSTGAVADLAAIGAVVRATPALLVVDSVSGLAGIEMKQDVWGVDILLSASQKALMCPPGLGLASVSEKAWKAIDRDDGRARFYWDFRKARDAAVKGQTAFTPAVSIAVGLREALRMIFEEGLPDVLARHRRLGEALRLGGQALGLSVFTKSPLVSDTVTVFDVPAGLEGGAIVRHMYERYGTVIAGARNKLAGKVIRFGTMGHLDDSDIVTDLMHLERTLADLGRPAARGAGMAAAIERLSRRQATP